MIEVEREIYYLEQPKVYSIRMTSVKPYGKHYPKSIYVSAIFDKNLEKAKAKAWDAFIEEVQNIDRNDRMYDGVRRDILEVHIKYKGDSRR